MQQRKILVTSSLPYANGDLHLGHIIESIQTDVWVRFQKMRGHQCYYICGSDAHGTPIMLRAEKDKITPEELVKNTRLSHIKDYHDFLIAFDNFHTTHSVESQHWTETIYKKIKDNGDILVKTIEQAFDPAKNMFLPDRFVKGECPKCHTPDQYGDSCEACGATYSPMDMKNPVSVLSGETPITKNSEHLFFDLPKHAEFLKTWLQTGSHVQKSIAQKLNEWFEQGLQPWDISRDAPYFGFKIPGTENKYFYVWLDAPIGYIASFAKFCYENPAIDFDEFWEKNTDTELHQFIGKDVMYFHTLFWPALLHSANLRLPTSVYAHGFLTINGLKMSKSRGTFILARTYLNHFNPEYIRYYFASKLNNSLEDIDLNFEDFKQKVNSDLVGKLINIASRTAGFINKYFDGQLSNEICNEALYHEFTQAAETIAQHYEQRQYAAAMREIMRLADLANQYVNDQQPWAMIKNDEKKNEAQNVCTLALNLFRILIIYLKPVLPTLAKKVAEFLNVADFQWQDSLLPLLDHKINEYKMLMTRIEDQQITNLQNEAQQILNPQTVTKVQAKKEEIKSEENKTVSIEDFAKIDLRVARVAHAESIPEADKLLKLQLDLGPLGMRQVFAGIKASYQPEQLINQMVLCIVNLAPRKMRFGLSEGMVLVAGDGKGKVWLMQPQEGAEPGMIVK